jgi:nucleotide-binding universal stress UspA family protein
MKKILVPCDFSEPALEAYQFALNIATRSNAEVLVLKVVELPYAYEPSLGTLPYYFDVNLIKEIEASIKNSFEKVKEMHARKDSVTLHVIQGPVSFTIRQFILENQIDLVVMGTHGAGGWEEFWIGSNTEKIVRLSPAPVLAIRKSFELDQIKDIVFPTTLELNQSHLVERVVALQSFFSARLHLLLVNTPYNMKRTKDEMDMMNEYAEYFKLKDYTLNVRNDFYEADGIISFAKEIKASMIAMGTHGRKGLAHLLAGSVAENVVNHAEYPIWTFSVKQ